MEKMPQFVDMAREPQEPAEMENEIQENAPVYPYGLCISLCKEEIDKLDLEDDVEVGDMIHMHSLAKVTSVSKRDTVSGTDMRVELQIIAIACENEDEENEEAEDDMEHQLGRRRPY